MRQCACARWTRLQNNGNRLSTRCVASLLSCCQDSDRFKMQNQESGGGGGGGGETHSTTRQPKKRKKDTKLTKCGRDMLLLLASLKASPVNSRGTHKTPCVWSERHSRLPPQRLFTWCQMSSVPLCDFTAEATCGKCFQQNFWKLGSGVLRKGISEVWHSRQGLENGSFPTVFNEPQDKNS